MHLSSRPSMDFAVWTPVVMFGFLAYALNCYLTVPGSPARTREPVLAIAVATGITPFIAAIVESKLFGEARAPLIVLAAALVTAGGASMCAMSLDANFALERPSVRGGVVLVILVLLAAANQCYQRHVF